VLRIAYFDCFSGASGDMILGALLHAGASLDRVREALAHLSVDGYEVDFDSVDSGGIQAGQFTVRLTDAPHAHRTFADIRHMLGQGNLPDTVRETAEAIFHRLAEAEGRVHGKPADQVHFHEVGAVDSIVDIVGAAAALEELAFDRIECSPIPPGSGTVQCAHGRLPVPAPATAELLKGVPLADSPVAEELTTPTGAAVLTSVADAFGPMPAMRLERVGYGAGQKRFEGVPNVLRLMIGEAAPTAEADRVWVLETTLDDVTGETIGYAIERLLACGALDAIAIPVQMKKGRPGVVVQVLCDPDRVSELEKVLFEETGTFGIRRYPVVRTKRQRRSVTVETPLGPVEGKLGWFQHEGEVFAPEYESCRRLAGRKGVPLATVYRMAREAYGQGEAATPDTE